MFISTDSRGIPGVLRNLKSNFIEIHDINAVFFE